MKRPAMALALVVAGFLGLMGCRTSSSSFRHLPKPAAGFHWEVFEEISVAVPAPDGWYRTVSKGKGTYTGSVSLEDCRTEGLFRTGFTVQVVDGVKRLTGQTPSMLAVLLGQEISKAPSNEVLASDSQKEQGALRSCFIRFRNSPALGDTITVHKFFVPFDSSDVLYIYTFESPGNTWEHAFQNYGMPMMDQVMMVR